MRVARRFALAWLWATLSFAAQAADTFITYNVVLLQPDDLMRARVPDIDQFAAYVRALQAQARLAFPAPGPGTGNGGFIVVAVRPGLRSNVWLDFDHPLMDSVSTGLIERLRALAPPAVQGGPVVFALKVGVWGGQASSRVAPAPREWRDAAAKEGHQLDIGDLVESIWKD